MRSFLARRSLVLVLGAIWPSLQNSFDQGNPRSLYLRNILAASEYPNVPTTPTSGDEDLKVGIIGAGAAGLYAALLLDTLGIDYDIFESSGRVGGRIFTYRFNETAWANSTPSDPDYYDYYDVGAMRFPVMDYMSRIIGTANNSLIPYINAQVTSSDDQVFQIPYIFTANNTFRRFNEIIQLNQCAPTADAFNAELADNGTVDAKFATVSPPDRWTNVTLNFTNILSENFSLGFDFLMDVDAQSIRGYLESQGYTGPEIDWMETINDATGHYDMYSMSQGVLEEWIFTQSGLNWTCINGGMDRIINGMLQVIKNKPFMNSPVTAIAPVSNGSLSLLVNETEWKYSHVLSTIPLGALQTVDLTTVNLGYAQRNAIRKLNYDPALKIGMKFQTRWWEQLPAPFKGGQSYSDRPIRRCVYPSYGFNLTNGTAPGIMIASYVWGQDSSRLGAHLSTPEAMTDLVNITLRDLAAMNNITLSTLQSQYVDYHAWDWYQNEWSVGAFAMFSPGQYSNIMPALMSPAQDGHLHFGGEALSSGHGWIIGAINSAYRIVLEVLKTEQRKPSIELLTQTWGTIDEVDLGWYIHT